MDPDWESGSGSRKAKIIHKKEVVQKFSCLEMLDVLFSELEASPVA
jgi:hypothetical protein